MKKKIILILLIIVGYTVIEYFYLYYINPLPPCSEITKQDLESKVLFDLREYRIPKWQDLSAEALGTNKPEIRFGTPDLTTSPKVKLLSIPVEIIGVNKTVRLFAIYECRDGHIEYSVNND